MVKQSKKNTSLHPWKRIDWKACNAELLRLQAKLYNALKLNYDIKTIKQIHNEILTSFASRAMAVRKVTSNKGAKTAGVDGVIWNRDEQKWRGIEWLKTIRWSNYKSEPIKRVEIPKKHSGEERPLGIPTIKDRVAQTIWNFILDVHQEHTADPRSFGFRIGRNAKQALSYIHKNTSGKQQKRMILSLDIKKAYDTVLHKWILNNIPINKSVLEQWLKAGVLHNGQYSKTTQGVPQGGPISPTIFNMVMNGIEKEVLKVRYCTPVRYADDMLVLARTSEQLNEALDLIEKFLNPRGLKINKEKTIIAKIETGFKYLGYFIREYEDITRQGKKGYGGKKGIVIVKPSSESITSVKQKVKAITKKYANATAGILIKELNPVIRGWANYFNAGGGWTKAKNKLGYYFWTLLNKWTRKKHRNFKGGVRKLMKMYFTRIQRRKTYFNSWTFNGVLKGSQILLVDIQEILVNNINTLQFDESINPYNPEAYEYFKTRHRSAIIKDIENNKQKRELLKKQDGLCAICGGIIDKTEKIEVDHIIAKADGGTNKKNNLRVVHVTCHHQKTATERRIRAIYAKAKMENEKIK